MGTVDLTETAERLVELRDSIAEVDRSLLELLHRRMELASEVGRVKVGTGQPIMVPEVHNRVLTRARQHADSCGVSEEVMESIFKSVMRGSIERQHRVGVELKSRGGSRLLILGGAGDMGGWFHNFALLLGHQIDIVDPAMGPLPSVEGRFGFLEEIDDLDVYEAIIVSVPLNRTIEVIENLISRHPKGLVIEIASIKDNLSAVLVKAEEAGLTVTSLHPMFGPRKSPYETLTFALAYRGDSRREQKRLENWLRHPYTQLVPVPFDHHDRLMGWLLGFTHLLGMAFGSALSRSGLGVQELQACASTSFNRQASAAMHVLGEDPDLYYEIQRLNPHRGDVYQATREALDELIESVQNDDREEFRDVLSQARKFLIADL